MIERPTENKRNIFQYKPTAPNWLEIVGEDCIPAHHDIHADSSNTSSNKLLQEFCHKNWLRIVSNEDCGRGVLRVVVAGGAGGAGAHR